MGLTNQLPMLSQLQLCSIISDADGMINYEGQGALIGL
jgi:hypothetical protein